mmetsp:Transcript_8505/g.23659  ORF Transcript_8505/g.23659 Transcript_8505/m.23659 type:complete len:80 (+) Transcript_8505:504-743(+)
MGRWRMQRADGRNPSTTRKMSKYLSGSFRGAEQVDSQSVDCGQPSVHCRTVPKNRCSGHLGQSASHHNNMELQACRTGL